jgi:alanyl-tRNA synthetase
MTERLYYEDSHMQNFTCRVLSCRKHNDMWISVLDRTAFFPEGGGQAADTGKIGAARVLDVQEKDGEILHCTDAPLDSGTEYQCSIDWQERFRRMQNHSGEHIVSGLAHSMYGCDNVGFHMSEHTVTIDFNVELDAEQLRVLERRANEAVTRNIPVCAEFPTREELEQMSYRSKKELSGDVRIVTIEGVDVCACCAPHVSMTGEIGIIKFLSFMRHRGGVRIDIACGSDALQDYCEKHESVEAISRAVSAKQSEVAAAVNRLLAENGQLKFRCGELSREALKIKIAAIDETDGNLCFFDNILTEPDLRELINAARARCGGIAAVFSGNDRDGYRYIIGSEHADLRSRASEINLGIGGRGGGKKEMIEGSASLSASEIEDYILKFGI